MPDIHDLLAELGDGAANARHAADIEAALEIEEGHTQEPTRDLIREAIVSEKIPIGSTPAHGYFLINSDAELEEVVEGLQARVHGLQRRIEALRHGWRRRQISREHGGNWPK